MPELSRAGWGFSTFSVHRELVGGIFGAVYEALDWAAQAGKFSAHGRLGQLLGGEATLHSDWQNVCVQARKPLGEQTSRQRPCAGPFSFAFPQRQWITSVSEVKTHLSLDVEGVPGAS
eukprot:2461034-Pyramimonas_sp.AAC.1